MKILCMIIPLLRNVNLLSAFFTHSPFEVRIARFRHEFGNRVLYKECSITMLRNLLWVHGRNLVVEESRVFKFLFDSFRACFIQVLYPRRRIS